MKEYIKEERENILKESEKRDFDEEKYENKENNNKLYSYKENIELEDFENEDFWKINNFLYIYPEVIFNICFFMGSFYKGIYNIVLFTPYFVLIIIFNCSFFDKRRYYCKNYLLISKLTSIEILISYPIYIIKEDYNKTEDKVFIIIYIIGAIFGILSFVYLNICFYRFQKISQFQIKKLYFLYFEIIAILLIHSILIFLYFPMESGINKGRGLYSIIEMPAIFIFELFLFVINCSYFYAIDDNDKSSIKYCKVILPIIKTPLYIIVHYYLDLLEILDIFFTFSIIGMIFMVFSYITLFIF